MPTYAVLIDRIRGANVATSVDGTVAVSDHEVYILTLSDD